MGIHNTSVKSKNSQAFRTQILPDGVELVVVDWAELRQLTLASGPVGFVHGVVPIR